MCPVKAFVAGIMDLKKCKNQESNSTKIVWLPILLLNHWKSSDQESLKRIIKQSADQKSLFQQVTYKWLLIAYAL